MIQFRINKYFTYAIFIIEKADGFYRIKLSENDDRNSRPTIVANITITDANCKFTEQLVSKFVKERCKNESEGLKDLILSMIDYLIKNYN